jgi:hypothetical protein
MLKKKGKVWKATGNACSHVIYIPADIVKDSAYPFKPKDLVNVQLDPTTKSLIITKARALTKVR